MNRIENRMHRLETNQGGKRTDIATTILTARKQWRDDPEGMRREWDARVKLVLAKRDAGKPLSKVEAARLRVYDVQHEQQP